MRLEQILDVVQVAVDVDEAYGLEGDAPLSIDFAEVVLVGAGQYLLLAESVLLARPELRHLEAGQQLDLTVR